MSMDTEAIRRFAQRAEQAIETSAFSQCASPVNTALSRLAQEESMGEADHLTVCLHLERSPMFAAMMADYQADLSAHPKKTRDAHTALMLLCARLYSAGRYAPAQDTL